MDGTIRFYRKNINISQQKLADMLELPRTELSFIETKKVFPKSQVAVKIAEILNIPIGSLWTVEELDFINFRSKTND